ncbi:MAG: hypothetical protein AAF265_08330 [Pseudomonadota bacterium]
MKTKTISGVAAAGVLLFSSTAAQALSLGEATVRSALGERLLIEIPISTASTTPTSCFSISPDGYRPGLLRIERIGNSLVLRSTQAVREPVLSFTLQAQCSGEAKLTRRYDVFIDPASRLTEQNRQLSASRVSASSSSREPTRVAAARPVARRQRAANPISGNQYTVVSGDTLWEIVDRMGAANGQHWRLIDEVVAANPTAFVGGNADRLVAGAVLMLPEGFNASVDGGAPAESQPTVASAQTASDAVSSMDTASIDTPVDVMPTAANDATVEDAAIANVTSTTQADRTAALLSVLSQDDSPFKEVPTESPEAEAELASVDTEAALTASGLETPPSATSTPADEIGWGARIGAVLAGVCLVIGAWVALQLLLGISARRRRIEASRNLQPERQRVPANLDSAPVPTAARSAPAAAQPMINAPVSDGSIEFEAPDQFASIDFELSPTEALDLDFEVGTPTLTGIEEVDWLDSQTQEMLEQDYEAELSRTQQIQKELAEQALKMRTTHNTASEEPTVNMPAVEDDTVDMPQAPGYEVSIEEYDVTAEELDLADAAIAEFTASLNVEDDLQAIEDSQRTASLELPADDSGASDDDATEVMPSAKEA